MVSPDVEVYRALGEAFRSLSLRWYVFGAQAAILHGAARFTQDVDVTVLLDPLEPDRLVDVLERNGFTLRVPDDPAFVAQTRVLPITHTTSRIPVDVVLGGPGLEEMFALRAVATDVGGVTIPVAALEDVLAMKVLAGRPKDLEDVVALLRVRADQIDFELVGETLSMIEGALDQSDLTPAFEQCRKRARR